MKRYCVYTHSFGNEVFYVGSGVTTKRPYEKVQRNKEWLKVTENKEYDITIVSSNLTKQDSIDLEIKTIKELSLEYNLVNKVLPAHSKLYDVEYLREILEYDETSETYLRWKVDRLTRGGNTKKGDPAGCKRNPKYNCRKITIDGKSHALHRIIWTILNGNIEDPLIIIDHIDGDSGNNKISNLRLVTQAENLRNKARSKTNKSGITGVYKGVKPSGLEYYRAQYTYKTKTKYKYFSISKYGEDEALRLAIEWRESKIKELNELGAGYSERHGK